MFPAVPSFCPAPKSECETRTQPGLASYCLTNSPPRPGPRTPERAARSAPKDQRHEAPQGPTPDDPYERAPHALRPGTPDDPLRPLPPASDSTPWSGPAPNRRHCPCPADPAAGRPGGNLATLRAPDPDSCPPRCRGPGTTAARQALSVPPPFRRPEPARARWTSRSEALAILPQSGLLLPCSHQHRAKVVRRTARCGRKAAPAPRPARQDRDASQPDAQVRRPTESTDRIARHLPRPAGGRRCIVPRPNPGQ